MINRKLGNNHALNLPSTFTRSSTAYNTDGTVVQANVPRFETNGVMVEEGTVNLISTVMTGWAIENHAVVELMPETYKGQPVYKVTLPTGYATRIHSDFVASGQAFSGSLYVKKASETQNNSTFLFFRQVGFGTNYGTKYISLTDVWQEVKFENIIVSANAMFLLYQPALTTLTTVFYVCMPKCEQKPYATSFHPTTRTPESLTIPASAIPVSEGTIEFDVALPSAYKQYQRLFTCGSGLWDENVMSIRRMNNTLLDLETRSNSGSYLRSPSATCVVGKNRVSFNWKTNECSFWVNGIKYALPSYVNLTAITKAFLGSYYVDTNLQQANALFSNLRISNKARSDAELANTGDLSVDYYTTYLLPCKTSITPKNF